MFQTVTGMLKGRLAALIVALVVVATAGLWYYKNRGLPFPSSRSDNSSSTVWISREGHDTAIVFVHGVSGALRETFTAANGVFWPDMLKNDPLFKDIDIYSYGYRSNLFEKGLSIKQLANDMHVALTAHEIVNKHKTLIFVCHSMGGLVTRAYLAAYKDEVRDKLGFLYFFSTPSSGSAIATIGHHLFPNTQLEQMGRDTGDAFLRDLQSDWLAAGYGTTLTSYCAYETKPMKGTVIIVPWASASGLCNQSLIAIQADHSDVVKPDSLNAKPHLALRAAFIENIERRPLERATLIPANRLELRYDATQANFSFGFNAVIKSARGSGDAIEEVYAKLIAPDAKSAIHFGEGTYTCTKDFNEVRTPFLFSASELSCTFSQRVGDLTRPVFRDSGVYRFTVTFETDDKRGHSVAYCFQLDDDDLSPEFFPPNGRRQFSYAICNDHGG